MLKSLAPSFHQEDSQTQWDEGARDVKNILDKEVISSFAKIRKTKRGIETHKVEFECRFTAWLEKGPNATDVGHTALVGIDRSYEIEANQTDSESFCLERGMIPRLGQNCPLRGCHNVICVSKR